MDDADDQRDFEEEEDDKLGDNETGDNETEGVGSGAGGKKKVKRGIHWGRSNLDELKEAANYWTQKQTYRVRENK
jgi:hypothetical protein